MPFKEWNLPDLEPDTLNILYSFDQGLNVSKNKFFYERTRQLVGSVPRLMLSIFVYFLFN